MKILITNNHLATTGGSETWVFTMAQELMRQGHDVEVYCFIHGQYAEYMKQQGINVVQDLKPEYDLMLINHNSCLSLILQRGIKGFKIFTSHGIYPALEQPISGADRYVAITKEVYEHIKQWNPVIIFNPIDCDKFKPIKSIKILFISDFTEARIMVKQACEKLNIQYFLKGKDCPTNELENIMANVDLVISLGRGCYEAMACGCNVIVYDSRSYNGSLADGIITPKTIDKFLENNCSGRYSKLKWTIDNLVEEIKKYNPVYGEFNRQYALNHFDVKKITNQYLKLYVLEKEK